MRNMRIKDIAALANVSEGTVDRVLHNRGNVSDASRKRVDDVLRDLNYQPNLYASALAHRRKSHLIVSLIPISQSSIYWTEIMDSIKEAQEELKSLNVEIRNIAFNQYDSKSFVESSQKALELNPQGIIFPPIFTKEAHQLLTLAKELKIGASIIDSYLNNDNIVSFIGQDGEQSGRLAAKLLLMQHNENHEILVFVSQRHEKRVSTQFSLRYRGFESYINEGHTNSTKIHKVELPFYDEQLSAQIVKEELAKHPNTTAMVTFNSRGYIMASVLCELKRKDITIIAYDVISKSVEYLKQGYITALIGTQPKLQGYRAVRSLCESVILKQPIRKLNFIPLDILYAENIDYYTQFDFK